MFVLDDTPAVTASAAVQKPEDSSHTKFEVEAEMEEKRIASSESELSSDEDTKDMLAAQRSSKPSVPSVRKVTLDHLKKSVPPNKVARVAPEGDEVSDRHMHWESNVQYTHTRARVCKCTCCLLYTSPSPRDS